MAALASLPREQSDYTVFFSADGSTWREVCSQMVTVRVQEQERSFAVTQTACNGPLITTGKRGAVIVEFRFLFTELTAAALGAWVIALTQWETDAGQLWFRYVPRKSETSDAKWYASADMDGNAAAGKMIRLLYPSANSEAPQDAVPFLAGCSVVIPRLGRLAIS